MSKVLQSDPGPTPYPPSVMARALRWAAAAARSQPDETVIEAACEACHATTCILVDSYAAERLDALAAEQEGRAAFLKARRGGAL